MCLSFNLRLEEILEMAEDITKRGCVLNPNWMKPDVRLFTDEEEEIIQILKFNYHLSQMALGLLRILTSKLLAQLST